MPQRYQLTRKKGYKIPEGTIVVARPTKWGNPFRAPLSNRAGREQAVKLFRAWLEQRDSKRAKTILRDIGELKGKDLACWCPVDQPCHADVLIELANK